MAVNQRLRNYRLYVKAGILGLIAAPYLLMFNNCSFVGGSPVEMQTVAPSSGTPDVDAPAFDVDTTKPTANVINYNSALYSMVSVAGLERTSDGTRRIWNDFQNLFSTDGTTDSITPPTWLAITNLAGGVCGELIDKERALEANQRRIFNMVNFNANREAAMNSTAMEDMIRRMARSFWGREETETEHASILKNIDEGNLQAPNNTAETRNTALMVCTGMLSSVAAVEM